MENIELDVMNELYEERKENERLTIEEIRKLRDETTIYKDELMGDSLGYGFLIIILWCMSQAVKEPYNYLTYISVIATIVVAIRDIMSRRENLLDKEKIIEQKEEELEQLRR